MAGRLVVLALIACVSPARADDGGGAPRAGPPRGSAAPSRAAPARTEDDPDAGPAGHPKPSEVRSAERVAADFLDAGARPPAVGATYAAAAALLSADYRRLIAAENDTPASYLGFRFGTLLDAPGSCRITSWALSPDGDEVRFEGAASAGPSRKTTGLTVRVGREGDGGKWRVCSFNVVRTAAPEEPTGTQTPAAAPTDGERPPLIPIAAAAARHRTNPAASRDRLALALPPPTRLVLRVDSSTRLARTEGKTTAELNIRPGP